MLEAHIRALEQSTMIALTLFASQSKQIIIKILDLKDILGLYCGIKVVIQCQIFDVTLSQYIVIRIAIRPCLSQYITIHFLVAIPIPSYAPIMKLTVNNFWLHIFQPSLKFLFFSPCPQKSIHRRHFPPFRINFE